MTTRSGVVTEVESLPINFEGRSVELPVVRGSEGELALDISCLRGATGLITLDTGYGNTGSCKSAITFIDGERGILRYRGYPIEELAERSDYLEVAWLLIHGELPSAEELDTFTRQVSRHTLLHENFRRFFDSLPKGAHPMPVCAAAIGTLATFYPEPESKETIHETIVRLIAKMPTIAAYSYKHSLGQPFLYPRNDLDYSRNLLRMMFGTPCEEYVAHPAVARALNLLLILHADHEQNCSTSTVRLVGSSLANLFASISAGISALWGPLHGGANQKVIEMLERIAADGGDVARFVARAKNGKAETRLMGFGHRVYKNFDPRAAILKKACSEVVSTVGSNDSARRLLDIAMRLEDVALRDDYFLSHKLYPNVDFYSGVIYKAIGIPENMFTVMFALGRLSGWIAQWLEMRDDPSFRIGRPRQVYTGPTVRSYVPVSARS